MPERRKEKRERGRICEKADGDRAKNWAWQASTSQKLPVPTDGHARLILSRSIVSPLHYIHIWDEFRTEDRKAAGFEVGLVACGITECEQSR